ncbi:trypsin-like peptidase domain-containing protein [Anaerovorax sp. IOR16]|uniref:trypsin-like peptidase domain-containing protein n=1 Tax=Anaerovorax sp. IOR16 TaxID=2773458 RepID=UPI0019D2C581|nr:trypsin-like peptidase domain-containing protein [Anaerovorax sp. IOR16]
MKKLLLGVILTITLTTTVYGASYIFNDANSTLYVNGSKVNCNPVTYNNTTYLPLRTVAETLGAEVGYNNTTKQIDINTVNTQKLAESCVMLFSEKGTEGHQGSGVYIDYGKILSCDHVTNGNTKHFTSDKLDLTLDKSNSTLDASILDSPNKDIKPVKIGDSDEVKVGDKVILITSPKGEKNKITYANVLERYPNGEKEILLWGKIDNGSSGGACFNMQGELVGILANGLDGSDLCAMIPINDIRKEL